jgi:hypothetical protein
VGGGATCTGLAGRLLASKKPSIERWGYRVGLDGASEHTPAIERGVKVGANGFSWEEEACGG